MIAMTLKRPCPSRRREATTPWTSLSRLPREHLTLELRQDAENLGLAYRSRQLVRCFPTCKGMVVANYRAE